MRRGMRLCQEQTIGFTAVQPIPSVAPNAKDIINHFCSTILRASPQTGVRGLARSVFGGDAAQPSRKSSLLKRNNDAKKLSMFKMDYVVSCVSLLNICLPL
jgi:hypothetical protein